MAACDQTGFCREDKCCGRAPTLKSLLLKQSLNELRDAIYEDAEVHGLWDTVKGSRVKPLENHMRYEAARRVGYEVREAMDAASQPEHFAEELADVVITALSAAGLLGIDIEKEVKAKMAINKERCYQHKASDHAVTLAQNPREYHAALPPGLPGARLGLQAHLPQVGRIRGLEAGRIRQEVGGQPKLRLHQSHGPAGGQAAGD
jgi:hypothetical protein